MQLSKPKFQLLNISSQEVKFFATLAKAMIFNQRADNKAKKLKKILGGLYFNIESCVKSI